ncbi:response regulator [Niveibacterium sp. 24ML]|uniref:response regulator n=1 Tax=Niveibacterium sp. 24ML TaxID=2985512 RepID=UPI00226D6A78|nr:response regulator [Niveibacterium sp. 24ML]MCX9157425.1 response regulator [Niveibacterium sp. 24ML]
MLNVFSGSWLQSWSVFADAVSSYGYLIAVFMGLALVFFCTAPLFRPEPLTPAEQRQIVPPAPKRRAVLVVDDSAVVRAKLQKLLESAGYEVALAQDGIEAEERLAERRFHLLITDLEMPRMNGFELIASVQGSLATERLPIIAITGHDALQARVRDCEGIFGIFQKPWNDRELLMRTEALTQLSELTWNVQNPRPQSLADA